VEKSNYVEQHTPKNTGQSHSPLKPPFPANKGHNMLGIAQSTFLLTKMNPLAGTPPTAEKKNRPSTLNSQPTAYCQYVIIRSGFKCLPQKLHPQKPRISPENIKNRLVPGIYYASKTHIADTSKNSPNTGKNRAKRPSCPQRAQQFSHKNSRAIP
jgi:hypothetical protein